MMKKFLLTLSICFLTVLLLPAQKGLFSGNYKHLIGKQVNFEKRDQTYIGFQNIGGFYLSFQDGSGLNLLIDLYKKGNKQLVVLLSQQENEPLATIQDILEVKNMPPHSYIQSATCAIGKSDPDIEILALEQQIGKKSKILKAWRASRDKLHFSSISPKGINCIVEGAD